MDHTAEINLIKNHDRVLNEPEEAERDIYHWEKFPLDAIRRIVSSQATRYCKVESGKSTKSNYEIWRGELSGRFLCFTALNDSLGVGTAGKFKCMKSQNSPFCSTTNTW